MNNKSQQLIHKIFLPKLKWMYTNNQNLRKYAEFHFESQDFLNCSVQFSSVQSLSRVQLFATPWIAARQASLSITNPRSILKLTSITLVMSFQPSHPLSSPSLPTFSLSQYQVLFQWVGSSHQVAKVLEFQLQYQSFQWIFRTDFL